MTNEQIKELLRVESAATLGPWFEQHEYDGSRTVCIIRSCDHMFCVNKALHVPGAPYDQWKENARLIAAARTAIRPLAEEVLRLRAEVAQWRERYPYTFRVPD